MRMLRISVVALFGASISLGLFGSQAAAETRTINLNGFNEVPVVITGATGRLQLKIAPDESSIAYTLKYEDIEGGDVRQAHIHLGQKHTTGNIVLWLCANNPPITPPASIPAPPACPPSPGTVSGTLTKDSVIAFPAQGVDTMDLSAVIEAIRKGVAYGNVHSAISPMGAVRGQFFGSH